MIQGTANDSIQSKDCIGLLRYDVGSNEPSLWVVTCLCLVERLGSGTKVSIMVQGRSLCARFYYFKKYIFNYILEKVIIILENKPKIIMAAIVMAIVFFILAFIVLHLSLIKNSPSFIFYFF